MRSRTSLLALLLLTACNSNEDASPKVAAPEPLGTENSIDPSNAAGSSDVAAVMKNIASGTFALKESTADDIVAAIKRCQGFSAGPDAWISRQTKNDAKVIASRKDKLTSHDILAFDNSVVQITVYQGPPVSSRCDITTQVPDMEAAQSAETKIRQAFGIGNSFAVGFDVGGNEKLSFGRAKKNTGRVYFAAVLEHLK